MLPLSRRRTRPITVLALVPLSAFALALSACGNATMDGADAFVPTAGTPLPPRQLTTVSSPKGSLIFSEQTNLTVRYADDKGEPLTDAPVQFALVGRAHDSSLSAVSKDTDEHGVVSIALTAGTAPSVFQVRASAERATPLLFDVSVSNAGFGSLIVRAEGSGTRSAESHRINLYTETRCETEGLDLLPADRVEDTDALARDLSVTRLNDLAAGLSLTVRVEALDANGERLELGCAEAVPIEADGDVTVDVQLAPLPLSTAGHYQFAMSVASQSAGDAAEAVFQRAAEASLSANGGAATTLLDALEQHLRDSGEAVAANALQMQRSGADLDGDLDTTLAQSDAEPLTAIATRANTIASAFGDLTFHGVWTAGSSAPGPVALSITDVIVAASAPSSIALDTTALVNRGLSYIQLGSATNLALDLFEGSEVHLGVSIGEVATTYLESSVPGSQHLQHLLLSQLGCDGFVQWVQLQDSVNAVCDDGCAQIACELGLSDSASEGLAALESPELSGQLLSLTGDIVGTPDATVAGTFDGPMDGSWHPALGAAPAFDATGELRATRMAP